MATIKTIFRASAYKESEGTIYFRIIHKRRVRQIHTGNRIRRDEWNEQDGKIIVSGSHVRSEYLKKVDNKLRDCRARLERTVSILEFSGRDYSADDVAEQYLASQKVIGFISFARKLIQENHDMGKVSAVGHYSSALNSFIRYYGEEELSFEDFDSRLMVNYECYLKGNGLCPNTTSFYMRKLRAIYNQAVDRELTVQRNPFKHVYTGIAKTVKRAVTIDTIKALRNLDLKSDPQSELARDLFLFSFCTRGMSFIDMSYLKKSNLCNGVLTYRRQKTKRQLTIRWEQHMQEIVNRHRIDESEYLLPVIVSGCKEPRRQYLNAFHRLNKRLKKLGQQIGLAEPLTFYRARHGWASIAQNNNVPLPVICEGMGHDSEKTTRIYLASIDSSVVDEANNSILSLLES